MTKMLRCPACMGQKKVMKLGMTLYDCETCFGIGSVKEYEIPKPSISKENVEKHLEELEECRDQADSIAASMVKENFPAVYDDDFKPRKGISNDKKKK